nr:histone-lysine N-methyltransferase SETMAR [Haemonchus contortus]
MPHDFKPSQIYPRNTILFFLSDEQPAEIDRRMKEVYKKVALAGCTVYKWHSRFTSNDYSIEDEDRPGRSMELDLDVLRSQVKVDPYQTTRKVAVTLESQSTVIRGLKSISKVRKLGQYVPHALKQYDMDRRADMTLTLLTRRNGSGVYVSMYLEELTILYLTIPRAFICVASSPSYDL